MFVRRLVFLALSLLLAAPALGVSMEKRSPITQGTWWNPARSGSGFEIFNTADQIVVIWYTYESNGRPVWYYAQGDLASLGKESWQLQRHRWVDGRKAGYTVVGTVRLDARNPELADLSWSIDGKTGTWSIQPFTPSGIQSEIDHSGMWFDPSNSGWGLSFTEQGDVVGGALLFYDAAGDPTWVAGYERATGSVALNQYTGSCPACTYAGYTARGIGRLSFDFGDENAMVVRTTFTTPMASGVSIDGARVSQLGRPSSWRAPDRQLASFDSGAALKAFLDAGMANLTLPYVPVPNGFSAPGPSASVPSFSTTNLQESGVDEADVVKSDGRYIYTYAHNASGTRQPALRIARTEDGSSLEIAGSVPLASGTATGMMNAGLFLAGDRLASTSAASIYTVRPWFPPGNWGGGTTYAEVLDATDRARPSTLWRAEIDGFLIATRRIGGRMYLVTRFVPSLEGFVVQPYAPEQVSANQRLLAATPLADLLPKIRINGGPAMPLAAPSAVYVPPLGGRKPVADMIAIVAIDLASPRIADTMVIFGSVETVYVSPSNLFIASSRYLLRGRGGYLLAEPWFNTTDIHQVALGVEGMSIVGSASIEGFLGDASPDTVPFRLGEHEGRLRVVTSSLNNWGGNAANRLTILEPSAITPGMLKTVSYIPNAERPQTLGKPSEFLHATRFVEDRLYAVTFKKIDPLYVVDLSDAADPRIAGALELPGFSDYLHPLPNGLLLGFGKDTRPSGSISGDGDFAWYQGLQLTLFDVSRIGAPRQLQTLLMGKRGSDSDLLRDHHAFSALGREDGSLSIAFPARINDGAAPPNSPDWYYYPWLESGLMRVDVVGTTPQDARLAQRQSLITHNPAKTGTSSFADPAVAGGRAVLFPSASIYVGNGQFWRQDAMGTVSGPY